MLAFFTAPRGTCETGCHPPPLPQSPSYWERKHLSLCVDLAFKLPTLLLGKGGAKLPVTHFTYSSASFTPDLPKVPGLLPQRPPCSPCAQGSLKCVSGECELLPAPVAAGT